MEQISIEQAIGKTVKHIGERKREMLIIFDDGSYLYLTADYNGWEEVQINSDETFDLSFNDFGSAALIALGIRTQEEVDQENRERLEFQRQRAEDHDWAEYQRLSAKYAGRAA